ncbi:thioredoxin domain-containing protein [Candidatus Peregrinibacteria bacterium]|nr:MAG: thioredoxin domain-containing protein [Candidatus Peregrinibacteria bacterium]
MKTMSHPIQRSLLAGLFAFLLTACSLSDAPTTIEGRTRATVGSDNATVVIQEFSDLQCPACAAIGPQMEAFVRENPTLARLEYYHFPLPQHTNAFKAAEASECALDQGKFWEFVQFAFSNQEQLGTDSLKTFAGKLGLNQEQFDTCLDEGQKRDFVRSDLALGRQMGVNATPSFYVNGQLVRWSGQEEFGAYVRSLQ